MKAFKLLLLIFVITNFTACGIRSIPIAKNEVEAQLAEVTNQYKRRADLIPNLVKTVKGYASHERETFESVTNARSNATSIKIDPSKATPEQLAKYQQAQGQLSQALGRLLMVSERYPDLKANQNFRDLQAQLEGTENRITIARQRHIQSIKKFNILATVFPTSITNNFYFKYEKLAQWDVKDGEVVDTPPSVDF